MIPVFWWLGDGWGIWGYCGISIYIYIYYDYIWLYNIIYVWNVHDTILNIHSCPPAGQLLFFLFLDLWPWAPWAPWAQDGTMAPPWVGRNRGRIHRTSGFFLYIIYISSIYVYIYIYMFIWNLRVWGKFSLCPSLGIVGTNISTWHTWHSFSFAQFSTWGYVKPISSNTKIQCVYIIYIHRIHSLILDDLGYPYCWNIRIGVTQFSLPKPSIFWLLFKVPFFMVTSPDIPTGPSIFLLNTVANISPLFSHFSTESLLFALPSVLVGWTGQ